MRTDLEELPVPSAVVSQEPVIFIQSCNRLRVLLGVIQGERLIRDRDAGDRLELVLRRVCIQESKHREEATY